MKHKWIEYAGVGKYGYWRCTKCRRKLLLNAEGYIRNKKAAKEEKCPGPTTKTKRVKAWADVGSHGGIFEFQSGPVADRGYTGLLHIFTKKMKGFVPVTITYKVPVK